MNTILMPFRKLGVFMLTVNRILRDDMLTFLILFTLVFLAFYSMLYTVYPRSGSNELDQASAFNDWSTALQALIYVAFLGEPADVAVDHAAFWALSPPQRVSYAIFLGFYVFFILVGMVRSFPFPYHTSYHTIPYVFFILVGMVRIGTGEAVCLLRASAPMYRRGAPPCPALCSQLVCSWQAARQPSDFAPRLACRWSGTPAQPAYCYALEHLREDAAGGAARLAPRAGAACAPDRAPCGDLVRARPGGHEDWPEARGQLRLCLPLRATEPGGSSHWRRH